MSKEQGNNLQMKKNAGNNIRFGVFVFLGLLLFITAVYFIGVKQQLFNSTFKISGTFKNVNGLRVGNNVRFSGINVGIIENVEIISDTSVKVDMTIDEKVRKFIKKNAVAIIGSEGLMGNQILIIASGTSGEREIQDNDVIKTVEPIRMENIMLQLKTTTDNAMTISDDLAAIMNNIRKGQGAVGKLLMDKQVGEELNQSIVNIKEGTGGFKQNMDAAQHSIFLRPFLKDKDKEKMKKEKKERKMEEQQDKEKAREEKKNKRWFSKKKKEEAE